MSNHVSVASIIEKNRLGSDVPYLAFIDVGVIDQSYYSTLIGMKALAPVDALIDGSSLKGKLLPTFVKSMQEGIPGGKLYAVPFSGNLGTLWYRTDLF